MLKFSSHSSNDTKKFAGQLAKKFLRRPVKKQLARLRRQALVLALNGDLGSGKTTFIQGFAKRLGIKEKILSPTFVVMKRFRIRENLRSNSCGFANFYHFDCYRLQKPQELLKLGFREIINNPQNIVLIEWPENIKKILPKKNIIWLKFDYGKKENERIIKIQ